MTDAGTKSAAQAPATSSPKPPSEPGADPTAIEIDPDRVDDPAFEEELSTYTASLSSSVVDYPVESGRRYHAFRKGSYVFPNDDRESERLDVSHHLMVRCMGGELYLAPIEKGKIHRVLDIGTGTGAWAIEMGDTLPNAEIIGCDLSPIQPSWVPPNVKFEVDDVESEWTYNSPFDFILCRYMAGSIGDWPKLFERIYDNVNPGGWAEFQDWDLRYYTDDNTLTDKYKTKNWIETFHKGLDSINRNAYPGPEIMGRAKKAGFINLHEKVYKVPLGPWAKDPELKQLGMINLVQCLDGLEGFSLKLFQMLGYATEEITVLLAQVRKELKSREIHAYILFYVVYGQKPPNPP